MVAIIAAAGRGTRMTSITGGSPKELLEIGGKPVLRRVVDEAIEADVDAIVLVTTPDKAQMNQIATTWDLPTPLRLAYQTRLNGLAGAVSAAGAEDDVVVFVGDCVYRGGSPAPRMASLVYRGLDGCVAVELVDEQRMSLFGIAEVDEGIGAITRILEKPSPEDTGSRWAVAGRFAISKPVVGFVNEFVSHHGSEGEVTLSDVIAAGIRQGIDFRAVPLLDGQQRLDCGSAEGFAFAKGLRWDG